MKGLVIGVALAFASVVALQGGSEEPAHSQDSQLEQGMNRVDGVLQHGLGEDTHDAIAKQADSSAEWLRGFGESVQEAAQ
jgi:hypothetical protein